MNHVKKGDEVIVLTGKDKGKIGTITKIIKNTHCIVTGINTYKKSIKANPNENQAGGFENKEMPIHISNLQKYNSDKKKGERTRCSTDDKGKKIRVFISEK